MNKKAALNLGISTVVVLVIAMVLIGAGISFIRTFFAAGESQLLGAFDIGDFERQPDSTNPIVLQAGRIQGGPGDTISVRLGFYNTEDASDFTFDVGTCSSALDSESANIDAIAQRVNTREAAGFITRFTIPEFADETPGEQRTAGTYVCTIQVHEARDDGQPTGNAVRSTQMEIFITN